jgi:hypothetical protein
MRMRSKELLASTLLAIAMIGCSSGADKGSNPNAPPTTTTPVVGPPTPVMGGTPPPAGVGTTPTPMTGTTPTPMTGTTPTPMTGTAGAPAMNPGPVMPGPTMMGEESLDGRGKCNIDSGFPDDEACLLPPAPGEGFQIHVGPKDYKDMADVSRFVFEPNRETSQCWSFHTPNTEDAYWQAFELSGRAGTHHIINTMFGTDQGDSTNFGGCGDPGTGTNPDIIGNLPGASKAYMPRNKVAPENAQLGRKVPAKAFSQADMHYFNFTDKAILREFWLNVYTVPKDKITGESKQIRGMGGLLWTAFPIAMGTDMVYKYQCPPLTSDGRIIALLGHYHSHGKRFAAFLNGTKVFEMYDYLDPKIFDYDSITKNPEFGPESAMQAGATSGIMNVKAGDVLSWECHIINNDQPGGLRYTNEVKTGEMCNLWGESVGPEINCVVP